MVDKQQLAAMGEHMREMGECKPEFKVPDGWKLVPVKPTPEMVEAYFAGKMEAQSYIHQMRARERVSRDYNSMLAAAPEYKP